MKLNARKDGRLESVMEGIDFVLRITFPRVGYISMAHWGCCGGVEGAATRIPMKSPTRA
jgi:hypothetical protein